MPLPFVPLDAELPLFQIGIHPPERPHFPGAQARLAPEQYDQQSRGVKLRFIRLGSGNVGVIE